MFFYLIFIISMLKMLTLRCNLVCQVIYFHHHLFAQTSMGLVHRHAGEKSGKLATKKSPL